MGKALTLDEVWALDVHPYTKLLYIHYKHHYKSGLRYNAKGVAQSTGMSTSDVVKYRQPLITMGLIYHHEDDLPGWLTVRGIENNV